MSTNDSNPTVEANTEAATTAESELDNFSESDPCEVTMVDDSTYMGVLFLAAVVMFIILFSTERRKGRSCGCCRGYCGILLSVNFLENMTNRSMIVAAFVLTTEDVIETIFALDEMTGIPKIALVFTRISMVCFISFSYLPLFHCISANTLLRQCLGLCYVLVIFPTSIVASTTVCHYSELSYFLIASHVTQYCIVGSAGGFLVCKFIYRIFVKRKKAQTSQTLREAKDPYQVQYIKDLLKKKSSVDEVKPNETKYTHRIRRFLYRNIPGFRFSITILTSVVLGVLLYVVMISSAVGAVIDFYVLLWKLIDENRSVLNDTMPNVVLEVAKAFTSHEVGNHTAHTESMSVAMFLETQLNTLYVSFFLAASLAGLQVCSTVVFMLKGYRKNVLSMYRQEFEDNVMEGIDNVSLVVCAIQFAGYQVAHMIWGYILQLVVFFVLILLFAEIVVFPVLFNYWGVIYALFSWLFPIFFVMYLSNYIQTVLVRKAFLVSQGRIFGINNRKCFFNMMFFMFFYNIFSGLISCVLRVVKVTILGVWFFPRLDMSVFPHSFEKYDAGYRAYVCLLKLEERQNNIILLTFVQLMVEKCCTTTERKEGSLPDQARSIALSAVRKKAPRNRWFLAWTLMHNKSLQDQRRGTSFETNDEESIVLPSSDTIPKKDGANSI